MLDKLKNSIAAEFGLTTYQLGLLQAKAYRILKMRTNHALKPYNISTIEWALLGMLSEKKEGLTFGEIAKQLGVEAPFVTELLGKLEQKKLVTLVYSELDRRSKKAFISKDGMKLVSTVEKELRQTMRPLLKSASIKDVLAYRRILEVIIKNSETK